jgi:hypothetical protein
MPTGLSRRQRDALAANSPSPDDILNNPEYIKELNDEISGSYNQRKAASQAAKDPTLQGAKPFTFDQEPKMPTKPEPAPLMPKDDLDEELERVTRAFEKERKKREVEQQKAAEAATPAQPEKTQEEMIREQIMELLKRTPGAPNEAQIAQLKKAYGENGVHVVALGDGDVYIFTHLRRGQWKKIQEIVAKAAQTEAFGGKADDMLKEKVIQHCILFPQGARDGDPTFLTNSRAGVIDTLFELVMLHSYFLTPQQAMQLTISL